MTTQATLATGADRDYTARILNKVERLKLQSSQLWVVLQDVSSHLLDTNPKATSINGNCFTVRSTDVLVNMSPFYHDFSAQYKAVLENASTLAERLPAEFLEDIINTGKMYRQNLHPTVLAALTNTLALMKDSK